LASTSSLPTTQSRSCTAKHRLRARQRGRQRPALGQPGGDAAVEHGDAIVTEPAQQPPQASGKGAAGIVVGDHLRRGRDAGSAELVGKPLRIGQRMASVAAVRRARQVVVEMEEEGARQMPGA
jgi:hypothetical protein